MSIFASISVVNSGFAGLGRQGTKEQSLPRKPNDPVDVTRDFRPAEMLKTRQFYMLWFMLACGAGAGLMVIAKLAAIATIQANIQLGFLLVAVLAAGNGVGRIVAGILSDRIGRKYTLLFVFVFQALSILLLSLARTGNILASVPVLALISAFIGANYGANLSLFPSLTKGFYGLKHFGMNYGLVFTAWGVGGFGLSLLVGRLYDVYQTFALAYYSASVLLIAAAVMSVFLKPPSVHYALRAEPLREHDIKRTGQLAEVS